MNIKRITAASLALLTMQLTAISPPSLASALNSSISSLEAASDRKNAILAHASVLENAWKSDLSMVSEVLSKQHLSAQYIESTSEYSHEILLKKIMAAGRQAQAVLYDMKGDEKLILLEGLERHTIAFEVEQEQPYKITKLSTFKKINGLNLSLTPENVAEKFEMLEKDHGFSGVVFLKLNGKVVMHQAYGLSNPMTKVHNNKDTIFGIGSRPIDFTTAAIHLLVQRGKLTLADNVGKLFDNAGDKSSITIEQLLNGQSGLRDFHHTKLDKDPDLTWIDRNEAVQRIFAQPLLFNPGEGESHSHSASVLLAAIIEKVSSTSYFDFLNAEFFAPAKMLSTGEYGTSRGHEITKFAVGGGPASYGKVNVPPYWGKTSWLLKGSGGMYSTIDDLNKFYDYVRDSGKLKGKYATLFNGPNISMDGSDRGFELFSSFDEAGSDRVFVMSNMALPNPLMFEIRDDLIRIIKSH